MDEQGENCSNHPKKQKTERYLPDIDSIKNLEKRKNEVRLL